MKFLVLLIVILFSTLSLIAQIEALTPDGKTVFLYPDRTWAYKHSFKETNYSLFDCSELIDINKGSGQNEYYSISDRGLMFIADTIHDLFLYITLNKYFNEPLSISILTDSACILNSSILTIIFRDSSNIMMQNKMGENCEGYFKSFFKDELDIKYHLKLLLDNEIQRFTITTLYFDIDVTFTPLQSRNFINVINCLVKSL